MPQIAAALEAQILTHHAMLGVSIHAAVKPWFNDAKSVDVGQYGRFSDLRCHLRESADEERPAGDRRDGVAGCPLAQSISAFRNPWCRRYRSWTPAQPLAGPMPRSHIAFCGRKHP